MGLELNSKKIINEISNLLNTGSINEVLTLFNDQNYKETIYSNSYEIIPLVTGYLSEDADKRNVYYCCQELLQHMAEFSNAEDVLFQFIEEIESARDDFKLVSMLLPLKTVLARIPEKRVIFFGWSFNAILGYLQQIEIPQDNDPSVEVKQVLDSDPMSIKVTSLYANILRFCNSLVQFQNVVSNENNLERRLIIGKFLIDLFGKPLGFLHMESNNDTTPKTRIIVETLVSFFFSLSLDPFHYLIVTPNNDYLKPYDLSLGIFFYSILVTNVGLKYVPQVYRPEYKFQNCLKLINASFNEKSNLLNDKAIALVNVLLNSIDKKELPHWLLDSDQHKLFCKNLSTGTVYNESGKRRKQCLDIFQKYLFSFNDQGRYLLLKNVVPTLTHSGLKGYFITQFKTMIAECITQMGSENIPKFYKNQKLFNILDTFTVLALKEETDFVDESDQIVSTLNLLRFLTILDKNGDIGIDVYLNKLEKGYLYYLRTGIDLSMGCYKSKIKELSEGQPHKQISKTTICQTTVTVSGENVPDMPKVKKIEMLQMSVTTLDVLNSLLNRLVECINLKKGII